MSDDLKKRIEALQQLIKTGGPDQENAIREEIKRLFIDVASAIKSLTASQEQLKKIATEFKNRKSASGDVAKFYSFVKSRTSAELDMATLLDRGWNLICIEDYEEAGKVLQQALGIDPKNIRALGLMGLILMNKEKYDQAMMYFQQVITGDPENAFALNNLGYICYKKGIWGEAIEHLTKAAKQKKDKMASLYANFYLGLVYYERTMYTDAVRFFEQALKLGSNLQEAHYYMGCTEMKRYEFEKAVQHFENCMKIDINSRYGRMAKEEADKIRPLIKPEILLKKNQRDDPVQDR
ncbi:MAG TPA: tetratricopeptide repeat protein [bacterium]